MDYENVFVAQVAYGAGGRAHLKAFLDAELPGVSIIIAYSPCIAHGVDLSFNLRQQDLDGGPGHWPLFRMTASARTGRNPLSWTVPHRPFPIATSPSTRPVSRYWNRLQPGDASRLMERVKRLPAARHQGYTELAAALVSAGSATNACRGETRMPDLTPLPRPDAEEPGSFPPRPHIHPRGDAALHLEDAGAAAIVMHSLFEGTSATTNG